MKSLPFMQRYLLRNGHEAYRRTTERLLATQTNNSGYTLVHLHRDNVRKARTVHVLVAEAFVSGWAEGLEVNHKNGVKGDCSAANLEWVTRSENHRHAFATGLRTR